MQELKLKLTPEQTVALLNLLQAEQDGRVRNYV